MKPTFSVIIPTLNEEKFVGNLLESLAEQTYRDFEVIVADGGSNDKTLRVVRRFAKKLPKLTIIKSPRAHVSHQRNLGAKKATGDWLIFMDADTIVIPTLLEEVERFLSAHPAKLLTTWCLPDGAAWWERGMAFLANFAGEISIVVGTQLAPGSLAIVDHESFHRVGGYKENLAWGEDYEFSERLADAGIKLVFLRKRLYVMSFRRFRRKGILPTFWLYCKSALRAVATRKTYESVPGYVMGGST